MSWIWALKPIQILRRDIGVEAMRLIFLILPNLLHLALYQESRAIRQIHKTGELREFQYRRWPVTHWLDVLSIFPVSDGPGTPVQSKAASLITDAGFARRLVNLLHPSVQILIHYGSPRSGNRIPTQEYTKKVQEALLGTPPNTVRAETPLTST